ncbi:MAG: carboxypeptidase-like regulatory domain-containing protein [Thiohalocapsa sp.]|jgi:hypothetical protein
MPGKFIFATVLATQCAFAVAGDVKGRVTDEQGAALRGVRICLSETGAAPGDCTKTRFTGKDGDYAFNGLGAGDYRVQVLSGASLAARKADPYPNLAWAPVSYDITLASRSQRTDGADFTGSFSFSNFQAEFQLGGGDFPELATYDLANDYVFLKVFTLDASSGEQDLIYLGQVTDVSKLLIEVSVPLSAQQLYYETYSADAPTPIVNTIGLSG